MSQITDEKRQVITVFLKSELIEMIRQKILGSKLSRSQLIEKILEEYLKKEK